MSGAALAFPAIAHGAGSAARIVTLPRFDPDDPLETRVRVWLPGDYEGSGLSYPVLYMLDGQFAFSGDSDGVNFAADSRVERLAGERRIRPWLIVAIDNLEEYRFLQYMPQSIHDRAKGDLRAAIDREIARTGGRPLVSAQFLQYLERRLKPFIDARYRTRPGRLDTAIFGASMAGVMSGAIFVEAQQAFGRAGCMSPNWPIYDARFIEHAQLVSLWPKYFARLGPPEGRRLWLDHGTEMMDAGMAPHQARIAQRLESLGWKRGRDLEARVHEGAGHAFAQTAAQMDDLLAWLLASAAHAE